MKVMFVEIYGRGGLTHYTYNLATALARRGAEVTLVTAREYELADALAGSASGVRLEPIFYAGSARARRWFAPFRNTRIRRQVKKLEYVLGTPAVIRLFRRTRPDVAHLQGSNPILLVTLIAIKLAGGKAVYTAHDVSPLANRGLSRLLDRYLYRFADRVVVHGDIDRARLVARYAVPEDKIRVIRHGNYLFFDSDAQSIGEGPAAARTNGGAGDPARRQARERLGLGREDAVVLFFGFLSWYKGLDLLVEAFGQVHGAMPRARLVVAGDPLKLRPGELDALRSRSRELGVAESVSWRTDYIPMDDVPDYFRAADCVALPYREASQSGVLHLAYAFARPVVASRVGAFPELVEEGGTGYLVPPGDTDALARALLRLLSDDEARDRFGREARRAAESAYDWTEVAAETEQLYGEIVTERAA